MAFNPNATFNNSRHALSAAYERLYKKLVPAAGKCDTVEGELLRASSRIYHDYYCNGFGNNWSGAFNYLDEHLGMTAGERRVLKGYARGRIVRKPGMYTADDAIAATLEGIAERVVQRALNSEREATSGRGISGGFIPNFDDMFDLQEKSTY